MANRRKITISDSQFARNLGFMTTDEQRILNKATVAIAGAGGDGGALAVLLARMGVGSIKLADPDVFEKENINRQACCSEKTVGRNKAEVVAEYIREINPGISTKVYSEGINESNVEEFIDESDLIIDEMEFTLHHLGVVLARAARQRKVPVVMAMNIGFGGTVTSFSPDGMSYERFLGLPEQATIDEIKNKEVDIARWLPYLPSYIDPIVLKKVAIGEKSAPSIAPGVSIAAGAAASQVFLHLVGRSNARKKPIFAPKVLAVDPYEHRFKVIRHPRISHLICLLHITLRSILNRIPKTGY